MKWFAQFDFDAKRIKWLTGLKDKGHKINMLDDAPDMNTLEELVLKSCLSFDSFSDSLDYATINGATDLQAFSELLIHCKKEVKKCQK